MSYELQGHPSSTGKKKLSLISCDFYKFLYSYFTMGTNIENRTKDIVDCILSSQGKYRPTGSKLREVILIL